MTTIVDTIAAIVRQELAGVRMTELGVVKATYPHAGDSDKDNYAADIELRGSGLPLRRVPIGTSHIGTVAIPNVGDQVLIAYDRGDVNQPIVIARVYDDVDRPPTSTSDEVVFRLPLAKADDKSVTAAIRNHSDADPPREVVLALAPKITVRMTDGAVTATAGRTELRLEQPGGSGGKVTVTAGGTTIEMDQDGDVTVTALGDLALKATGDLTLQAGRELKLTSTTATQITAGTQVTVQGGTQASVQATAVTVRGASVAINGVTTFGP
jgi:phage baseplate assembly protein gpV